ncbi:DUF1819 family protein [Cardiobacteriaceae bacterium TAE3-ERU3]|nr:DUF1819 family protein [Cardiobacteriaceae bacterium TAE3-ERU3]
MNNDRYSMSFTTGGILHRESVELALLYLDLGNWDSVRTQVIVENTLQTRTLSTLQRIYREASSRLQTLTLTEIEFLASCSYQEQSYILWLAICRRYRFVADFAIEVLRERHITLKGTLTHEDFDAFFNRKSEWHPELDKITPATRAKLRQVLFKILRETDLLTSDNLIQTALLSPRMLDMINQIRQSDILFFPVFESDVKEMKKCLPI